MKKPQLWEYLTSLYSRTRTSHVKTIIMGFIPSASWWAWLFLAMVLINTEEVMHATLLERDMVEYLEEVEGQQRVFAMDFSRLPLIDCCDESMENNSQYKEEGRR